MKHWITTAIRLVLGAFLISMGLNKFFGFLPPPGLSLAGTSFINDLAASGYVMQMVGATELVVGVMLLFYITTPIALLLLAPLSVNIFLFHVTLAPESILLAAMVAATNVFLLLIFFDYYRPLFAGLFHERVKIVKHNFEQEIVTEFGEDNVQSTA